MINWINKYKITLIMIPAGAAIGVIYGGFMGGFLGNIVSDFKNKKNNTNT
jgi:hypothetical protein